MENTVIKIRLGAFMSEACWYYRMYGKEFDVVRHFDVYKVVNDSEYEGQFILINDCIVVTDIVE